MKQVVTDETTFEIMLEKAKKYCAGKEHCQHDVVIKLHQWGAGNFAKNIVEQLINEGFISDKRFAELFVKSKINQNKWGRLKIEAALRIKNIAQSLIDDAIEKIDENDYLQNLNTLFLKKEKETDEKDDYTKQQKILFFLSSKGYETELIYKLFKK